MPGTASEKIFSFDAREIKEGELAGKIPAVDVRCIVTDGTMSVKYVMSYYIFYRHCPVCHNATKIYCWNFSSQLPLFDYSGIEGENLLRSCSWHQYNPKGRT